MNNVSAHALPGHKVIEAVRGHRRIFFALVCAALFLASLGRYWVHYDPSGSFPREPEPARLAHNLLERGQFASPFAALDTGPSAHMSPVIPAFLAFLMWCFGDGPRGLFAIQLSAVILLSLQLALYPLFSRLLGMGALSGIIGACIWIVAKPRILYDWEGLYVAMFFAITCCCYRLMIDRKSRVPRGIPWIQGFLMGLVILMLPTAAPVYAIWLVCFIYHKKNATLTGYFLPLVLLPLMIILPWTVRNFMVFHRLMFIRDDLGLELSVSNNDCAQFGVIANFTNGCFQRNHPNNNMSEAEKVLELGEARYNDLKLRQGLHWISSHPAKFAKLFLMRFVAFWMPTETFNVHYASGRRMERAGIYLMTILSIPGLVILYRRDRRSWAVAMSCLAVFPLTYYLVDFEYRYRYPIMWLTFLLGGLAIATFAGRLWKALYPSGRSRILLAQQPS